MACLLLLLALAAGLRGLVIHKSSVAARDTIGFIRYAWRLEHDPWDKVLQESLHPPLYPLSVLAASIAVRQTLHAAAPDCLTMQTSSQLAAALAGVLLVIRCTSWAGTVRSPGGLLVGAPVSVHAGRLAGAVGRLTEGMYLLLTATFLLVAGRRVSRSVLGFVACGC